LDGPPSKVICPSIECLLGDKLTAFAPHTTGIPYGINKELEMAKQLFDVAVLFDVVDNVNLVRTNFKNVALTELAYRKMKELTFEDVLWDTFHTSVLIGTRGSASEKEFAELVDGFKKMASFVYSGFFSQDSAILCAAKAAYLSALILQDVDRPERFKKDQDISSWIITNPDFNKLNKLKKTSPESFFYFFQALRLLEFEKN
jgi:hypothetical protein